MNEGQPIQHLGFPLLLMSALIACVAFTAAPVGAAEEKVSPGTVADGLQKIQDMAADSAEAVGKDNAKAEQLHAGIEPEWEKIEDTVRGNDSSAYVALEDSFTLLKIAAKGGDAAKASEASESLSAAVKGYLAKHPGADGSGADEVAASSSASGSSRSAAAAAPTTPAAPAESSAAPEGGTGSGTLARTGPGSGPLCALAGTALGLGGLAVIGGARRRIRRAG